MVSRLEERVAYGRAIRERASCLLEAHGAGALDAALRAVDEPGILAAERSFREAVADRVARTATAVSTAVPLDA